jgi:hypothetical protein
MMQKVGLGDDLETVSWTYNMFCFKIQSSKILMLPKETRGNHEWP